MFLLSRVRSPVSRGDGDGDDDCFLIDLVCIIGSVYSYVLKQSRRISAKAYSDLNFGTVTIDWNKGKVSRRVVSSFVLNTLTSASTTFQVRLSAHGVTDHLFRFSFPLFNVPGKILLFLRLTPI